MTDFSEFIKRGLPLNNVLIIDSHSHMGRFFGLTVPVFSAERMLETMNTLGIDIACISHHSAITNDYSYGNDQVIELLSKYPERFLGYCTVNPHYPEDIKDQLLSRLVVKGMMGIKIHPSIHQVPIDYRNYHRAYEIAEEKCCPVLVHTWGKAAVSELCKVAGMYPKATFIMGHAGGDIRAMEDAIEVVNKRSNVYADLALSRTFEGNVEWLVKEMGSHKVLYASDMPLIDPRPALGRVAMANMPEEDIRNILGLNMKKLLSKLI